MPKKIELSEVERRLPKFVKIISETYKGTRYKAKFIDLDYNKEFIAEVCSVIKLQHGCPERSNRLRSDALKGILPGNKIPIKDVISRLPVYLELDPMSYKGVRYKARFYDKEYKVWFEMYVCNVLRDGKGYCEQRYLNEFKKQITVPIEEVKERLFKLYGDKIKIIESTYCGTGGVASFIRENGKTFKLRVCVALSGRIDNSRAMDRHWKGAVLYRDKFTCQLCGTKNKLTAHHIFSWTGYEKYRFNLDNGICLCQKCHSEFHSKYGLGDNNLNQFLNYIKQKGERLSTLANDLVLRLNVKLPPVLQ